MMSKTDWLGPEHVVLSHFSLGAQPFKTRCAAAGAAGFDAIGLLHRDYLQLTNDGYTPSDLIELAATHNLQIVEIEAAPGWSAKGASDNEIQKMEVCLEMAAVFSARHLTAMGSFNGTIEEAAQGFARLCDRAAETGTQVGLEPIPVQETESIAIAREIVERAGRSNGGICVDSWHLVRGGNHWDQLESLPGELVVSIQINDGPQEPEHDQYIEDCLINRRLCGEGEFDLIRFVKTLDRIGATAPYSVEIISSDLWAMDPFVVAQQMADTTRTVLYEARK